jgi:hypothetical protein
MPKYVSQETQNKLIGLYSSGISVKNMKKEVGLCESFITKLLRNNGVVVTNNRGRLKGKRFGRLVVIRGVKDNDRKYYSWLCRCDCGGEVILSTYLLKSKHITGCGCLKEDISPQCNVTHGHVQNGQQSPEYKLWLQAKRRSREDGVVFNIMPEDIIIPEYCPVFIDTKLIQGSGVVTDSSPSLDRLIPELGYVKNNIRVISFKANTIKQNATAEELYLVADWLDRELKQQ